MDSWERAAKKLKQQGKPKPAPIPPGSNADILKNAIEAKKEELKTLAKKYKSDLTRFMQKHSNRAQQLLKASNKFIIIAQVYDTESGETLETYYLNGDGLRRHNQGRPVSATVDEVATFTASYGVIGKMSVYDYLMNRLNDIAEQA